MFEVLKNSEEGFALQSHQMFYAEAIVLRWQVGLEMGRWHWRPLIKALKWMKHFATLHLQCSASSIRCWRTTKCMHWKSRAVDMIGDDYVIAGNIREFTSDWQNTFNGNEGAGCHKLAGSDYSGAAYGTERECVGLRGEYSREFNMINDSLCHEAVRLFWGRAAGAYVVHKEGAVTMGNGYWNRAKE